MHFTRAYTRSGTGRQVAGILPRCTVVWVWLLFSMSLSAQPFNFVNWSLDEGLPQSQVFSLCQDSRGYLWAGTQGGGLCRFDGKAFTAYTIADGLPSNYVNAVAGDGQAGVWVGTNQGLCRFDGQTCSLISFDSTDTGPEVYALAQVQKGLFWIGTDRGLYACSENGRNAYRIPLPGVSTQPVVRAIFPSKTGVWVGTALGAWLMGNRTVRLSERTGLACSSVYAFARDEQDQLWMAGIGGVSVLEEGSLKIRQTYRDPGLRYALCLQADSSGRMWVGTQDKGLFCHQAADSSWIQLLEKDGLPHQHIHCLQKDRAGQLWIGSSGGGLARLSQQPFRHFDPARGLNGNRVYALHEDRRGRLWLGVATNGLQVLDSTGFHAFERDSGHLRVKCKTIASDLRGNLWVGTEGKGIAVFDSTGMHRLGRKEGLQSELVQKIAADPTDSGQVWVATLTGGIAQVRFDSGQFFVRTYGVKEGLPDVQIQSLLVSADGTVWFVTQSGHVGRLSGGTTAVFDRRNGLPGKAVRTLAFDQRGRLWVGTKGAGIFWADTSAAPLRFVPLPEKWRASSPNIYLLACDAQNRLWAGTETGVDCFSFDADQKQPANVRHYGRSEGFSGIETCHDAVLEDRNGYLWFGTMNGLTQYLAIEQGRKTAAPSLHFEGISLFYKPLAETRFAAFAAADGGLADGLSLPYFQNHLSFAFQAVDLTNPDALRYRWRLEGAETEWSPLLPQTQVNYANLVPGVYTFLVQATTDGETFSEPLTATFTIRQPLWQLWWFQALGALTLVGLVLITAIIRVRRIRRAEQARREKLEVENRLLQLEQKALQLQMNPHFIFNALTSIQSLITEKNYPNARQEISRFAQLMRGILANSRQQTITLQEEVQTLEHYLQIEQFCHQQKFRFHLEIPDNLDPEELELPPMLLQPFVENAVVHGVSHLTYPGEIDIRFRLEGEQLYCEIRDNGIGRERAARLREEKKPGHQSVALQVTQERLAALGGSLTITDVLNEDGSIGGTAVLISLPVTLQF